MSLEVNSDSIEKQESSLISSEKKSASRTPISSITAIKSNSRKVEPAPQPDEEKVLVNTAN